MLAIPRILLGLWLIRTVTSLPAATKDHKCLVDDSYKFAALDFPVDTDEDSQRELIDAQCIERCKWAVGGGAAVVTGGVGVVATAPVLGLAGFTAGGIASGSLAAKVVSEAATGNGGVASSESVVTYLQSAAASDSGSWASSIFHGIGAAIEVGAGVTDGICQAACKIV